MAVSCCNCCCQDYPLWLLLKVFLAVPRILQMLLSGLSFMVFDQCQLLYHNCCCQDYPLWYLIKMVMAVSYYSITAAVKIILDDIRPRCL